jgi:hypothetical protein
MSYNYSTNENTEKKTMETIRKKSRRTAKVLAFLGVGLCALCCTLPVIGVAAGTGILSMIAVCAEDIALLLLIVAVAILSIALLKKKPIRTCDINCDCKTQKSGDVIA